MDPTIVVGGVVTFGAFGTAAYLILRRSGYGSLTRDVDSEDAADVFDGLSKEGEEAVEAGTTFATSTEEAIKDGQHFISEGEDVIEELEEGYETVTLTDESNPSGKQDLTNVKGIGPTRADGFREEGFGTPDDLYYATDENLLAIEGIGDLTVRQIREDVGSIEDEQ